MPSVRRRSSSASPSRRRSPSWRTEAATSTPARWRPTATSTRRSSSSNSSSRSATGLYLIQGGIALSRCYRETGDLALAIEAGERVEAGHRRHRTRRDRRGGPALAHHRRRLHRARRPASRQPHLHDSGRASGRALPPSVARAGAYWNSSFVLSERGDIEAALPLASRALALLAEGRDARNLARLRIRVGELQLQSDPPEVDAGAGPALPRAGRAGAHRARARWTAPTTRSRSRTRTYVRRPRARARGLPTWPRPWPERRSAWSRPERSSSAGRHTRPWVGRTRPGGPTSTPSTSCPARCRPGCGATVVRAGRPVGRGRRHGRRPRGIPKCGCDQRLCRHVTGEPSRSTSNAAVKT